MTKGSLIAHCARLAPIALLIGCGESAPLRQPLPTVTSSATATVTSTPSATPTALLGAARSGGDTTVFNVSRDAFAQPAANLSDEGERRFFTGNALFNRNWVSAPASTTGLDGLGPVFNARSCSACHFKDGRGRPPADVTDPDPSLLFRLSVPGLDPQNGPLPDPAYGDQLQPFGLLLVPGEARVRITHTSQAASFADGMPYELQSPHYEITDLAFGPLAPDIEVSPRVAPALVGLGLLAAVDEADMRAWADEDDRDEDGVSGRINVVWDVRQATFTPGRFGWKANQPTLEQQNAAAFLGDIGITSSLFPENNCAAAQSECRAAPNGGAPELDDDKLAFVTFYTHTLAVPARRGVDTPEVSTGEQLFHDIGCTACHVASVVTGVVDDFPELSQQRIHPYTDLLLHDMGDGLADHRPDFAADGREWRTPPLWGIGLVPVVNRHSRFLHDGRARDLSEAILWHGGEAAAAQQRFVELPVHLRSALLHFLESL